MTISTASCRRALDIGQSDVDGAVRMAIAADDQLTLPTLERKGKMSAAQIATRKKTIYARSLNQDAYMRALERSETGVRHRPGRHRQDLSGGRACGDAARARHGRAHHPVAARRSRPASGWASCRAT